MSGSNGIVKYLKVNREDEVSDLVTRSSRLHQMDISNITQANISGIEFLADLAFSNLTPNALNAPSIAELRAALQLTVKMEPMVTTWTDLWANNDIVDKVITLPAGYFPTSITIPPQSVMEVKWIWNGYNPVAPIPEFALLSSDVSYYGGIAFPPGGAVDGDTLVYYNGAWTIARNNPYPAQNNVFKGFTVTDGDAGGVANNLIYTSTASTNSFISLRLRSERVQDNVTTTRRTAIVAVEGEPDYADGSETEPRFLLQGRSFASGVVDPSPSEPNTEPSRYAVGTNGLYNLAFFVNDYPIAPPFRCPFFVTQKGHVRLEPLNTPIVGGNLGLDVLGKVTQGVSTLASKENLEEIPQLLDIIPKANTFTYKSDSSSLHYSGFVADYLHASALDQKYKDMMLCYEVTYDENGSAIINKNKPCNVKIDAINTILVDNLRNKVEELSAQIVSLEDRLTAGGL